MVVDEAIIHPTTLTRASNIVDSQLLSEAKEEAKRLSQHNINPMGQSNTGCYRTILPQDGADKLNAVCQIIEEKLMQICSKKNIELMFGCEFWLNVNDKGSSNDSHAHYGSALSGVYYLDAEETGPLVFHSIHKSMGTTSYCDDNQVNFEIEPADNSMVIFPSWAMHSVSENVSDKQRICIAFNGR